MTNPIDIDTLILKTGKHAAPSNGLADACVMEAVAYVAGEPWSDHPECASQVLGAFLRSWNDSLPDVDRQMLKQYIPRLVGSKGTKEREDARAFMAMDWLVREYTPVWLRAAKLDKQAELLEALPEIRRGMAVPSIRPTIDTVRADARAAWDAAWDAARAAARAAAWDAARDAAWDAARDAARAAARDAARAAAWDAARDALRPSVVALQASAHHLVDRMLMVTGS